MGSPVNGTPDDDPDMNRGLREAARDVHVRRWTGGREPLRPLFELAEDSGAQLDAYLDQGTVLVAYVRGTATGHLQLIDTDGPADVELKNMAVREALQGLGIGRALVHAAVEHARVEGRRRIVVSTASADVGNLRFYQRQGFRMLSVERDAFVPATGYPDPVLIDGIALRDRVWLDRVLDE